MSPIEQARRLLTAGQFADALRTLNSAPTTSSHRIAADVLRAEVLERLGQPEQARATIDLLLRSKSLTPREQSTCESVLARIEIDDGNFDVAAIGLQRSISVASSIGDYERACTAQLKLLLILSDHSGPEAVASLLAELRINAVRTGNPSMVAAVHMHVALMEAKRSLVTSARRHVRLALKLIEGTSNLWLESMGAHIEVATAIIASEFVEGVVHARRAVQLSEQSGAACSYATSLGNFGNLLYLTGDFDQSAEYQERAVRRSPSRSDNYFAGLESLARLRLAQDRVDDCEHLLDEIEQSIQSPQHQGRYVYRHALLTRVNVLARRRRIEPALAQVETVIQLAKLSGDHLLWCLALLSKAELMQQTADTSAGLAIVEDIVSTITTQPPDVYALYERVLACALARAGMVTFAQSHFERSKRIYETLHHAPGLVELTWSWRIANADVGSSDDDMAVARASESDRASSVTSVLHSVATLMAYAGRPELMARELVQVIWVTGCVESVSAVLHASDGSEEILSHLGESNNGSPLSIGRRLLVGLVRERAVELVVRIKSDAESVATLNAVTVLLTSCQDLERARSDREERATLWPIEELPIDGDRFVISGHMRELMSFAQRIARTNVNVLITGESGTGKEILARAIHNFSDRAKKPFVPFNCTAVPRDLLESQLFGHRRGAFTGADRDHAGLIRAAREGTLFLDEIGEFGLDLQPKLLRFLEAGEIAPLGEPGPLTVNVRIIAATNAKIEDAVRSGKFREDLFYRLNVVRLSIRPLRERRDEIPGLVNHFAARAAEEFKKGNVRIAEETMERLLFYRWPGNVRQLQNELRRMVALTEPNSALLPHAISEEILGALPLLRPTTFNGKEIAVPLQDKLPLTLARIECEMIKAALKEHRGKVEATAKALGISRKGLYLKRQRLGL